jgi:iron complex outermembrane recepter protein
MKVRKRIVLSTIVASILCMPNILVAEEKNSQEINLSPVIVEADLSEDSSYKYYITESDSATRTGTPLRETAQSVQVLSSEIISDINAVNIDDTVDYVSGVSRQNNFGGMWDNIAIRGFAGNENTGMSLLRNGFADNRGFNPPRDTANVEKIEFLKGPSGALYGNSEPGGTMNVVTKKPEFSPKNQIETTVGSDNFYRVAGDSTGGITDSFAYRLNLAFERKDSFRDHVESERLLIAPSLFWALSDNTFLSYDGEHIKQGGTLDRGIVAIDENVNIMNHETFLGNPSDGDNTLKNYTHQLKLEHDFLNNWTAKAGVAYKTGSLKGVASEVKPFVNVTGDSVKLRTRDRDYSSKDLSFQADLKGEFEITKDIKNTLLVGVESYDFEIDSVMYTLNNSVQVDNILSNPTYTVLATGKGTKTTDRLEKQEGTAVFVQDEIALGDSFRLLGGLRYDSVDIEMTNRNTNITTEQSDYAVSPRIGLTYLLDPKWSIYATSGKSFRPNTGVDENGNSFEAEEGLSFEVGVKFESLDKTVGATLALFQIEKENVVSSDPSGTYSIATGEVRSKGLEFDINGKLTENIKVSANYAYTDTEVTKDNGGIKDWATGEVVNLEGKQLSYVPKHSGGLLVMYEDTIQNNGKYGIGGGVSYVGKRAGNYINSFYVPGYTTTQLISYWQIKDDLTFKFNVNNLFDKEYIESGYDRSWLAPGSPRSFTLSMNYKF